VASGWRFFCAEDRGRDQRGKYKYGEQATQHVKTAPIGKSLGIVSS
jgi:hypothetical protein